MPTTGSSLREDATCMRDTSSSLDLVRSDFILTYVTLTSEKSFADMA